MTPKFVTAICLALPWWLSAAEPEALRIRVVDSSGPVQVAGTRTAKLLSVELSDENGNPVAGATVSFRLPASGASGVFSSGLNLDVVTTGEDGKASIGGVRWGKTPGSFEVRIAAAKGPLRASAAVQKRLLAPAVNGQLALARLSAGRSRRKAFLLLAGAAAGSVAVGLAISRRAGGVTGAATESLSVGAPTVITVGGP